MSDLDFDELDKAVNSLMNKRQDQDVESVDDVTRPKDLANLSDKNNQNNRKDNSFATPSSTPSPQIRRSTGRFMDVVLPASAGRADDLSSRRVRPRDTTNLQPVGDSSSVELTTDQFTENVVAVDSPEQNFSEQTTTPINVTTPMKSPFLSDIEVDKRPLGLSDEGVGLADDIAVALEPRDGDIESVTDMDEVMHEAVAVADIDMEAASVDAAVLGADLSMVNDEQLMAEHNDAVETDTNQPESDSEVATETDLEKLKVEDFHDFNEKLSVGPSDDDRSVEPNVEASQQQIDSPIKLEAEPAQEDVAELNGVNTLEPIAQDRPTLGPARQPGDILPQYTPESTDAPEPSYVFEAASESPRELDHPEKARSGWMVVVWIVALIILGAAGGVGAWYFLIK